MSRTKSICTDAGGGSLLSSIPAAGEAQTTQAASSPLAAKTHWRRPWSRHARLFAFITHHASRITLIPQPHVHVRTVPRRVASRRPAGAHPEIRGVVFLADIDMPGSHARALDLPMASEAEVQIGLDQQLGVDAAVRIMTDRAALPQRRMLKYKGPGLLSVTLRTGFVPALREGCT